MMLKMICTILFVMIERFTMTPVFILPKFSWMPIRSKKLLFKNVVSFKNAAGAKYSNWEKYPDSSIDPEEMRYNPKTKSVVWSSEGARVIAKDFTVIQNPSLQTASLNGNYHKRI